MPWPHVVVFYLGIPILMSVMFGINHAGQARHMSIAMGIPYWLGLWVPFWLMLEVATRTTAVALRPWSAPLWLLLILGAGLALLASREYVLWYIGHVRGWLPTPDVVVEPPAFADAWREVDRLMGFLGTPLFWMAINYYYDRVLGLPRYRGRLLELNEPVSTAGVATWPAPVAMQSAQGSAGNEAAARLAVGPASGTGNAGGSDTAAGDSGPSAPALQDGGRLVAVAVATAPSLALLASAGAAVPPLFALLPPTIGVDILALQAEDHYVRVHTTQGSALVRYRFSDAMRELEAFDGLRVHRSFWVRRSAISHIDRGQRSWAVVLTDAQRIPVSVAFREALRKAITA